MRAKDIILIVLAFAGMAAGIFIPSAGSLLTPYILYGMMTVLFLAFLTLDFKSLLKVDIKSLWEASFWTLLKLLLMPLFLWALTNMFAPAYALPVLLLSGTSVGVTSPFFATILGASPRPVLHSLFLSSMLVPLTLPALVDLLYGTQMDISFLSMTRMLLLVIFVPGLAAFFVKTFLPGFTKALGRVQFQISVTLFALINMGVFAPYADFLISQQERFLEIGLLAMALGPIYAGLPLIAARLFPSRLDGLGGAVGFTYINNVLIVVFSARFFGPDSTLLAALYMLPLFIMLLPLRWLARTKALAVSGH